MAGTAKKPLLPPWYNLLAPTKDGNPRANLSNCVIVLREAPEFGGAIGFDVLRHETFVLKPLPWDEHLQGSRPWVEVDDSCLAIWLQEHDLAASSKLAAEAVETFAQRQRPFHPVLEYLDRVKWDGEPRLDTWTIDYLGCEDTPYVREVSAKWPISACARIADPGTKADCVLVLEGPQGTGKSTALRTLGGPWFTDEIAALGTKDAAEQLNGVWIVELAELSAVRRAADIATLNAFITRSTDRYRPSYGRRVRECPRQCVFAASTNDDQWNRDDTGGRRWWPLATTTIDVDGLRAVRDQLWAEAWTRYQTDEPWWLQGAAIITQAKAEQEGRLTLDPWENPIARWVDENAHRDGLTTTEILRDVLSIPIAEHDIAKQTRVGRIFMQRLKWHRRQQRVSGERVRRYWRTKAESL